MYVSRLFIKNFRNFRNCDVTLQNGVTCFIGENNVGKSNLLDAVRLVLDGSLSPYRRKLRAEDLSEGLSFSKPEHILIAVEWTDFTGTPAQEALPLEALIGPDRARLSFRYRPIATVREALVNKQPDVLPLTMTDYRWELVGGGTKVDLAEVGWADDFGNYFRMDVLQQSFLVVLMNALRDVESSLAQSRSSPLQQIIEQRKIPEAEQKALISHLETANASINASTTISGIGGQLSKSFLSAVGPTFGMSVGLGLGEPSFNDISRALRVLLSGYGLNSPW